MRKLYKFKTIRLSTRSLFLGSIAVFTIVFAVTVVARFWNASAQKTEKTETPQLSKSETNPVNYQEILQKAREQGTVKIIAGFEFNFVPEGNLSDSLKNNQRAGIKQNQDSILQKLKSFKPQNVVQFESIPYFAATIDAETLEYLKNLPEINFIREDVFFKPMLAESTGVVRAPQAWNLGYSGQGQVVAVLDSGVDKNHPFLAGKVVSEACYGLNIPAQGISSLCPGGATQSTTSGSGLHCTFGNCFHGTHVAGIAAGKLSSGNFQGVARDANLVAMQVFVRVDNPQICGSSQPCIRTDGSLYHPALQRVLNLKQSGMNIASVNMSLGGDRFTSYCDSQFADIKATIDNLRSLGVATVIASGNEGYFDSIAAPACISSAVSVGNSGDGSACPTGSTYCPAGNVAPLDQVMTEVPGGSNSASFLNLLAPGRWITSSFPGGTYNTIQGTSMAAPHVAGAWAVLKQHSPNASVTQVLNALTSTGQPITDPRNGIVKPRIKIDAAIQAINNPPSQFPISLLSPIGVATTSEGNIHVVSDNVQNLLFSSFTPSGTVIRQTPYGDFGSVGGIGHLAVDPTSGWIANLWQDGRISVHNPATGEAAFILGGQSIRQMSVNTSNIFDVETLQYRPIAVSPNLATYGDLTVVQRNAQTIDLLVTASQQNKPFVVKIRLGASSLQSLRTQQPTSLTAKVIAGSIVTADTTFPPGIAVTSQGKVLTTLPVCSNDTSCPAAWNTAVTFGIDFHEGQGALPTRPFNRADFPSEGMTNDSAGNYYVATRRVSQLCQGASGFVKVPADLSAASCLATANDPFVTRDVAINPGGNTAYITLTSSINNQGGLVEFPLGGGNCTYTLNPTSQNFPAAGGTNGAFQVNTQTAMRRFRLPPTRARREARRLPSADKTLLLIKLPGKRVARTA
jgi:subtilisin